MIVNENDTLIWLALGMLAFIVWVLIRHIEYLDDKLHAVALVQARGMRVSDDEP